ncbi:MAG: hypothetical protein ACJAVR_003591 [Paracoccaceae bacterium]|jgi:hypothetical protein
MTNVPELPPATAPALTHVTDLFVDLGPVLTVGDTPQGRRRIIPIIGGCAVGPQLNGRILDLGADWQVAGTDGLAQIDTRYCLQTDDGALIDIRNLGLRAASPAVAARLADGEAVDPAEYYFRTTPRLFCTDGRHDWVNRRIFIGVGQRLAAQVVMRVFEVG